jgi:hypothetical protein
LENLAHRAAVSLPEDFIHTNAIPDFVDGMKARQVKQRLNIGVDRFLNHILKLHDAKTTAGPPSSPGDIRDGPQSITDTA